MNKIDYHQIAYRFLQEACEVLGMDVNAVPVHYAELPDLPLELLPEDAIPKDMAGGLADRQAIPVTFLPISGGVIVNERFLDECLEKESSTPVRMMMYTAAYAVFAPASTAKEQTTFATALALVKGIQPGDNAAIMRLGEEKITAMVNRFFHLDCKIVKAQCEDGSWRYVLRVMKDNNPHQPQPTIKTHTDYEQAPKGTEDNPFENVDDAAAYIKEQEEKEWTADAYMQELVNSPYYYEWSDGHFRIGWASPFVSLYRNEMPDDGFVVNQLVSRRFSIKPNLYRHKFLFRGQSRYYDKCYPNLFRDENKTNFLDDVIWSQELQSLGASHPLVQYCERGIELLHDRFVFEMNYGGLTQHYYNRSPFLDLTSDIESAKFFAVTDYDHSNDQYTPTKNTGIGVLYYYSIEMPGAFRGIGNTALSTIGKQVFMRSGAQHGFLLRMNKGANFNILSEVRKVFFKHDAAISQRIFDASAGGINYFPHDALEAVCREHLEVLKKNKTVSMKAVEINLRFNPKETKDSIVSQLAAKGIRVDDTLVPTFPKEHLTREALVQMWDTFSEGVYFYSPDSLLYQEALKRKRDEVAKLI